MHEYHLIDKMFNVIVEEAAQRCFTRVDTVTLKLGRMNGLTQQHFTDALSARGESIFEHTKLAIEEIPVNLLCNRCRCHFADERFGDLHFAHATSHAPDMYLAPPCPRCGTENAKIVGGRELLLVSIEGS